MRDLFMSYSRKNRRFVERLASDLREHHVDVWLDVIDLEVGDLVNHAVEQAIEDSRYFCIALSPASLASFYVRQVEFESAFTRLVNEKRDNFILPILIQKIEQPLPARLAGRLYLDFTNRKNYHKNMKDLVKKVKLQDVKFAGQRWYKGLDISHYGEPVGVGEVAQMPSLGGSYLITWKDGIVVRVDVYANGTKTNYKQFGYDRQGRVIENAMFSPDGKGGWHVVEDIWYYTYDDTTGRRKTKLMKKLDASSGRQITYDDQGTVIDDKVVTDSQDSPEA